MGLGSLQRVGKLGRLRTLALLAAVMAGCAASPVALGGVLTGGAVKGIREVMGLEARPNQHYQVQQIETCAAGNVLWPGEKAEFTLQIINKSGQAMKAGGKVNVVHYGTGTGEDIFELKAFKIGDLPGEPIQVEIPAGGFVNLKVSPKIPEQFGAYALVVDLDGYGRQFGAACVRVPKAHAERAQFPTYALDFQSGKAEEMEMLSRLGIQGVRIEIGYVPTISRDFKPFMEKLTATMAAAQKAGITVMCTFGGTQETAAQPLGRPRPHLDAQGRFLATKSDLAWLPQYDEDFEKFARIIASQFGWPKGPVNAIELWNEPWEGISIAGWGADIPRYRDIYTHMAMGIEAARKEAGVQVLIGGTCSSMNTDDKLFSDGQNTFLKWLDFTSIHYQPMGGVPILYKDWQARQSPFGPVRVWDTESWIANSEDRVAVAVASMRAQGLSRAAGVHHEHVRDLQTLRALTDKGPEKENRLVIQTWPPAAAIAACQQFIGQRDFGRLLFDRGMPWIFVFDGKQNPDDGTLVVVGDLSGIYDRDRLLYRNLLGLANRPKVAELKRELAALPPEVSAAKRKELTNALRSAMVLHDAQLTMSDGGGMFSLYDFYGNPLPSKNGIITVPLNGLGYFLRPNGKPGSMAKLVEAARTARIDGYEPVDILAHDMLTKVDSGGALTLTLHNILNRPITGKLHATLGTLKLGGLDQTITLAAGESRDITLPIVGGKAAENNMYALAASFDAGADGQAMHDENVHVNLIAKRSVVVDGDLKDWDGVLPHTITGDGTVASDMTERAWRPFEKFDDAAGQGMASGYMAYDDRYFYFAAKIADKTNDEGMLRFANRNDDSYFYPDTVYDVDRSKALSKRENIWAASTKDVSGLQKPQTPGERIMAAWETWQTPYSAFAIDIKGKPGTARELALYFLDSDTMGRRNVKVEILDSASGKVLAVTDVRDFKYGKYAVFQVSGNVRVRLGNNSWLGASLSGYFFGPSQPAADGKPSSARLIKIDETTQGNWQGVYGSAGYCVIGAGGAKMPADADVTVPDIQAPMELKWPEGVRHYSYRRNPEIPSGAGKKDNVQIAFNVIPQEQKDWLASPAGTMPKFMMTKDTDYEYALNPVAASAGGGTEMWRLLSPGMPRKHFFPRQPKSAIDGGPVAGGQLAMTRDKGVRFVEAAIPWSEIPDVRKQLDAGGTIKFSFRVNDNGAAPYEVGAGRSVSRINTYAFHDYWAASWANEVEFAFER